MRSNILTDKNINELFSFLSDQQRYVFFDTSKPDGSNNRSLLFTHPKTELQYHFGQSRQEFLEQTSYWLDQGYYLAGWFSYEFMHDELSLPMNAQNMLLADLGVYPPPKVFNHQDGSGDFPDLSNPNTEHSQEQGYRLSNLLPAMGEQEYCQAIRAILEYIAAGDTYQVNYTFKLNFDFSGSAADFYRDLRRSQPVPYGCCIKNGESYTLSFSPELFFRMEPDKIVAKPMKGTTGRGRNGEEDSGNAKELQQDVKNRSENVMIVDLLRNDLSRLVDSTGGGTVGVDSLFDVEHYRTVLQMTSTVVARRFLKNGVTPKQIMQAIFPCGSVTGAPKIRTMQIIDELEKEPRGVYTGAIGYFSPDRQAMFNVPIRTVVLDGNRGEMGIGSGIVADSSPEDEWRECLLKARFLTHPPPKFKLLETMLHVPGNGFLYLDDHLRRLSDSARYFGFPCDVKEIRDKLEQQAEKFHKNCMRVRLTLSGDHDICITTAECDGPKYLNIVEISNQLRDPAEQDVLIDFSEEHTNSNSYWLFHKTTQRELYDRVYQQAQSQGLFDLIFCNEHSEITEGCISNIIVGKNGRYLTPPQHCGLLAGVMRKNLLKQKEGLVVEEQVLYKADILQADSLFICNSVRGVVPARLRKLTSC